jgi:hypothetical protein
VADGIYASMNEVQATAFKPMADRATADVELCQLRPGHKSVLTRRKRGDHLVDGTRVTLSPYYGLNCTLVCHTPIVARQLWRRSRGL